jgi:hypothetical protein
MTPNIPTMTPEPPAGFLHPLRRLPSAARTYANTLIQDARFLRNSEQAFQTLSRLVNDHKLIAHYREALTVTLIGRASTRMAMNLVAEAERDCQAALDLVSRLIDERKRRGAPESPQYLSLLGQMLVRTSQIHIRQGRSADARTALTQAADNLSRAVQIDPARESDKVRLEQIRTSLAQMEK